MRLSAEAFELRLRERIEMEHGCTPPPARGNSLSGWDAARVSDYLRRELDEGAAPPPKLVIIGAGRHAKVIIEILESTGEYEIAGCTSASCDTAALLGIPVLGDDSVLPSLLASGVQYAFPAVGENRTRLKIIRELAAAGFRLPNAVSHTAIVSPRARLGCGIAVMPGAVINADTEIGDGAIINTAATVDHDCRIGPCAHIAPGTNVAGSVTIGEGTFLGAGSRVIDGIAIGGWSVVGAGAVVVRDLPDAVVAMGVPATIQHS